MTDGKISWTVTEEAPTQKTYNWYWAVGILGTGGAAASIIAQNYLFAALIVVGAFALMLAGSRGGRRYTITLSERGVRLGHDLIPMEKVKRFCIAEDESPLTLVLDLEHTAGMLSAPIPETVDYRAIRTLLKNKNIEETDDMRPAIDTLARAIGL